MSNREEKKKRQLGRIIEKEELKTKKKILPEKLDTAIKQSKFLIKLKNYRPPKIVFSGLTIFLWAFIILLGLNLFNIVEITLFNYFKTIAFYFIIVEISTYMEKAHNVNKTF